MDIWKKIKPDDELLTRILESLEKQKQTQQWNNKQFIPHPATWLIQNRWDDIIETESYREGLESV